MPRELRYAQFLTPAVCVFCLLNACYVTTVTSVVLAREEQILKRLRGTSLPAWTYPAGRFGTAFLTAATSAAIIINHRRSVLPRADSLACGLLVVLGWAWQRPSS